MYREVSKIAGEPVVNVRKIRQVRTVKAPTGVNKILAVKQDKIKALGDAADDADI